MAGLLRECLDDGASAADARRTAHRRDARAVALGERAAPPLLHLRIGRVRQHGTDRGVGAACLANDAPALRT